MTVRIALVDEWHAHEEMPGGVDELARIGSALLVGERTAPILHGQGAALVGWAFHREAFRPCAALPGEMVDVIVRTGGQWAVGNLWGNFVLAWTDRSGEVYLLRSPVTGPPLFQAVEACGGRGAAQKVAAWRRCAFTDLSLARALGFRLDRLEPGIVDAQLRYPLLRAPWTGIAGVRGRAFQPDSSGSSDLG